MLNANSYSLCSLYKQRLLRANQNVASREAVP